jgi:hypothetical protein
MNETRELLLVSVAVFCLRDAVYPDYMAEPGDGGRDSPSPKPEEGAWIFVSHSHRDLQSVRRVRDALEANGHQPLLFFLKCLGDDAEIDGPIRREIEARQFFLLCDSVNARESRWVQQEVALIKELAGKVSLALELDGDWQNQLQVIDELSRRATVFISHLSRGDTQIASEIAWALRANDYRVIDPDDADHDPEAALTRLREAAQDVAISHGHLLLLLSPESVNSVEMLVELRAMVRFAGDPSAAAAERWAELVEDASIVVPLIVSERERTVARLGSSRLGRELREIGHNVEPLDFTSGDFNDNIAKLLRILTN